ncbi:PREDICTED: replication protein A 70 kDa DNA-binding subunit B-like [Ipomoea nil]|uniref:replication protein A 70 kDa DNA-binding subunit B-like n=1 Tax=Ipomoea nil TaxID=35883 RepID=UPI000901214D|nr:PREDICTED: replication protein A 70 kDa DNA-binding subunit B-like [Ipomoea nil]
MANALNLIDIDTQTVRWSCKVRVIKKNEPRNAIKSPDKKYMLIILEDETGTRVQSIVFDNDIEIYDSTLKTNKWYIISSAIVKPAQTNYRVLDNKYKYTWILNAQTSIQTSDNADTPLPTIEQSYTPFSEFYECMKKSQEISIVGIVIDKLAKEFISTMNGKQKINDFIVVDENLKPIILTMWGEYADKEGSLITREIEAGNYPVISAEYIAVVHFKGISLTTRTNSTILLHPEVPRAERLKEWGTKHRATLDALKRCRDYNDAAIKLANPETAEISTIDSVPQSIDPSKPVWIKGKISFKPQIKNTWYIGCSHCMKKVYAESDKLFHCMHCGEMNAVGTPRCKLDVEITDGSGGLVASVFGKCAEQLLLSTSKQIMQLEQQVFLLYHPQPLMFYSKLT